VNKRPKQLAWTENWGRTIKVPKYPWSKLVPQLLWNCRFFFHCISSPRQAQVQVGFGACHTINHARYAICTTKVIKHTSNPEEHVMHTNFVLMTIGPKQAMYMGRWVEQVPCYKPRSCHCAQVALCRRQQRCVLCARHSMPTVHVYYCSPIMKWWRLWLTKHRIFKWLRRLKFNVGCTVDAEIM
jgi:hypothetical protein